MSAESREEFWKRWLPPRALPKTGKHKPYKVGQTWAVCCYGTDAEVASIERVGNGRVDVNRLAGYPSNGWALTSLRDEQCVLVQDVGEAEPRPPSVLFTEISPEKGGWPKTCLRCAGREAVAAFACVECWSLHRSECSKLGDAWNKYRRLPFLAARKPCGQCRGIDGHQAGCPEEPAPAAGKPPSVTRQHDFSDPYCAMRGHPSGPLELLCKACGCTRSVKGLPCPGPSDWRARREHDLWSSDIHHRVRSVGDLLDGFERHDRARAAAIASLGGYPGCQRDVSGVGTLTDGIWDVAPERGR